LIIYVYNAVPFLDVFWPYLPIFSTSELLSAENLTIAVILSIIACGDRIRASGLDLSQRIVEAREDAESDRWKRSLTGEVPGRHDVLALHVRWTPKDEWYKKPFGMVLIGIITGSITLLIREFFYFSE
jgi:hypothetical protein